MNKDKIKEELDFLLKYAIDLEGMDETEVKLLAATSRTKEEEINYLLDLAIEYEALLG